MLSLNRLIEMSELQIAAKCSGNYFMCFKCEVSWAGSSTCWSCGNDRQETKSEFIASLMYEVSFYQRQQDNP